MMRERRRPETYRHRRRDAALALFLCLFLCSPQTPVTAQDGRRRDVKTNDSNSELWNPANSSVSQVSTMGNYSASISEEEVGVPVAEGEAEPAAASALAALGNEPTLLAANKDDIIGNFPETEQGREAAAEAEAEAGGASVASEVPEAEAEAADKRNIVATAPTDYDNNDNDLPEAEPEASEPETPEAESEEPRTILDSVLDVSHTSPLTASEAESEIGLDTLVDPVIVCMHMAKPFVFRIECEIDEIIYPPAILALEEFRLHFQGLDVDLVQAIKA